MATLKMTITIADLADRNGSFGVILWDSKYEIAFRLALSQKQRNPIKTVKLHAIG